MFVSRHQITPEHANIMFDEINQNIDNMIIISPIISHIYSRTKREFFDCILEHICSMIEMLIQDNRNIDMLLINARIPRELIAEVKRQIYLTEIDYVDMNDETDIRKSSILILGGKEYYFGTEDKIISDERMNSKLYSFNSKNEEDYNLISFEEEDYEEDIKLYNIQDLVNNTIRYFMNKIIQDILLTKIEIRRNMNIVMII